MIISVFAIYDSKSEAFMQPFFMQTKGAALRAFSDTVQDPSTSFNKHPADFTLFQIGEYDDSSGKLSSTKTPLSLGTALEYLSKAQNEIPNISPKSEPLQIANQ